LTTLVASSHAHCAGKDTSIMAYIIVHNYAHLYVIVLCVKF